MISLTHVTKTTCSETASQDINFKYYSQEFAFIDPTWIKKFSGDFKSSPQFEALVTRFVGILKNSKPDQPKS
jgi:hypothetical protein